MSTDFSNIAVLVIDDDESTCTALASLVEIQKGPRQVFTALNIKDAALIMGENEIGLVISDNNMEGGNGVDLLQTMREQKNNTPFLLITGLPTPELRDMVLNSHAASMLQKPAHCDQVMMSIDALMNEENTLRHAAPGL